MRAFKKLEVWKAPPVLIVHLKRFENARSFFGFSARRGKVDTFVKYPVDGLSLESYVRGPDKARIPYDLFAVSEHSGGLGGGHYTAVARDLERRSGGDWFDFNDSSVSPVRAPVEDSVVSASGYVLFYARRGFAGEGAGAGAAAGSVGGASGGETDVDMHGV